MFVIYIVLGIIESSPFKQKLAGYWGSSNRLAKADSEAFSVSSAGNGTSV